MSIQEIIDRLEEIDGNGHYLNTTNLIKELKELRDEDTEILDCKKCKSRMFFECVGSTIYEGCEFMTMVEQYKSIKREYEQAMKEKP